MQIPIRLYRQHDMDLIRMYMNKTIRFTAEIKNAIIAYANDKPYRIQITDSPPEYKGYLKTSIMVHISIDEKKHPEVLTLFNKLKKGQRCAFIKTLTRRYMTELPLSTYFNGDGIIMSKAVALKLEENGYTVEGNSLLVNKDIPQKQTVKTPENDPAKAEKKTKPIPIEKETTKPTIVANTKGNDLLNPSAINVVETQSDDEPMFDPNDMYIPDDHVPYEHELMQEIPFAEAEDDDSKDGATSGAFDLFGKLAH